MAYLNKGKGPRTRGGMRRGGMLRGFGPRAWRSDGNVFSCLATEDNMSSGSDMEDDKLDKFESLLFQTQKKRRFNISSGDGSKFSSVDNFNGDLETDYDALSIDEKLTLILNKVCLYENWFCDLTNRLDSIACKHKHVAKIETVVRCHEDRIRLLEHRSIDIEARARRNNLIFHGLAEFRNENCANVICQFVKDNFDIEIDQTVICRAHRLGRFQGGDKRRPIIVAFQEYKINEDIIHNAQNLRETRFSVSRDYPLEITRARKTLWPDYKRVKKRTLLPRPLLYIRLSWS